MTIDQLSKLKTHNVLVIGDIILDEYIYGEIHRMSPEAPVPVVLESNKRFFLGGAANVAHNIQTLGSKATLIGITGNDVYKDIVLQLLQEANIDNKLIHCNRKTTLKSRIIVDNKQVVRVDSEDTFYLKQEDENHLLTLIKTRLESEKYDGLIMQDYNKGIFSPSVIKNILSMCNMFGIPTFVDPKYKNIKEYAGCTVFKPNMDELNKIASGSNIDSKIQNLSYLLRCKYIICTQGKEGLSIHHNGQTKSFPTQKISHPDVSGAGDSTLAGITLAYLSGYEMDDIAKVGNISGHVACSKALIASVYYYEIGKHLL